MSDPVPSKATCPVCDTPDGDHLDWCTPQAREQRPSKDLPEVQLTPEQEARAALLNDFITLAGWWRRAAGLIVHMQDQAKEMEAELERRQAKIMKLGASTPPGESPAEKALRDCLLLAMRRLRKGAIEAADWEHIVRFCKEGGVEPSPLRSETTEGGQS